jgi:DNA processing protein
MNSCPVVTPLHNSYPDSLRLLQYPPPVLYILGNCRPIDQNAVAVVGSRDMTNYGRRITVQFVKAFSKAKITVVSGLAKGIDTVAHKVALNSGGRTIAVLGNGLDTIYPSQNALLAEQIVKHGALISEFPPGTKPLGKNFLNRNRIIAGLSKAILVVEGAKRSGTLSTASWAANFGREVFAVPGPIDSKHSQAPLYLIEQGARVAKNPQDIIEYINSVP